MAEFVESALEEYVPVLEQLQSTQLIESNERVAFVKKCRRFEYKLQKLSKNPSDFLNYASYLRDLLALVRLRKKATKCEVPPMILENPIRMKACNVYHRLCQRFCGKIEYWRTFLAFVTKEDMTTLCSRVYQEVLQFHPRNASMRIEAANWELDRNNNETNARRILQLGLRLDEEETALWKALFTLQIKVVMKSVRRLLILEGKGKEAKKEKVAVEDEQKVDVQLAEVVIQQAVQHFKEQPDKLTDVLLHFYRECLSAGQPVNALTRTTHEQLMETDKETQWRMEVIRKNADGEAMADIVKGLLGENPTPDQRRFFLFLYDSDQSLRNDPSMVDKMEEQIFALSDEGVATEKEYERIIEAPRDARFYDVIEKAAQKFPSNVEFARLLIEMDLEKEGKSEEEIDALGEKINRIVSNMREEGAEEIFRMAVHFAIQFRPDTVEEVFKRVIAKANGETKGAMKALRVEYLASLLEKGTIDEKTVREEYKALTERRPNTPLFYSTLCSVLSSASVPSSLSSLLPVVHESAVSEHGGDSVQVWLDYMEYLASKDPLKVSSVHMRAMGFLHADLVQEFVTQSTQLQQRITRESILGKRKSSS